jgi:hypothetical protein
MANTVAPIVNGANYPPLYGWDGTIPTAGAYGAEGYMFVQPEGPTGLTNTDENYLWYLPLTFDTATKTYTAGAAKRYIVKVPTCDLLQNRLADMVFDSVNNVGYLSGRHGANCDLSSFDATTIKTAANGTTFSGTALSNSGPDYVFFNCDYQTLYGTNIGVFAPDMFTIDTTTGVSTVIPDSGTTGNGNGNDVAGSSCVCPAIVPASECPSGPGPSPTPTPGNCGALATTHPAGKVAPGKTFSYVTLA